MLFGLDGVEIGLIIVFLCLFGGILSGFPVAFAIGGAGVVSFGIIAGLDSAGLLIHQAIDRSSEAYNALLATGARADSVTIFRYPDLPRTGVPVFPQGWETALDRNVSFIVNRINERVLAGAAIETLLACRHTLSWMLGQLRSTPREEWPSGFRELVAQHAGVTLSDEEVEWALRPIRGERAHGFGEANTLVCSVGAVMANHFGVGFVSDNHTAEHVEATAIGPGAEALPHRIENYELHALMVNAMALA